MIERMDIEVNLKDESGQFDGWQYLNKMKIELDLRALCFLKRVGRGYVLNFKVIIAIYSI